MLSTIYLAHDAQKSYIVSPVTHIKVILPPSLAAEKVSNPIPPKKIIIYMNPPSEKKVT